MRKISNNNNNNNNNKFSRNGSYELNSLDSNMKYVGQTGKSYSTPYKEHFLNSEYNNGNSKFCQLLIEFGHSFCPH